MASFALLRVRHLPGGGTPAGRSFGRTASPVPMEALTKLIGYTKEYAYPEKVKAFYASPSTRCVDTLKVLYP